MIKRAFKNVEALWEKGAFHILIGTFLSKFVVFFGSIFVVRILSKNEFGLLSFAESIYSYAYIFAGLGLSNAILRYVVLKDKINDKYNISLYIIKNSFFINCGMSILLILISLFALPHTILNNSFFMAMILFLLLPFQYLVECCLLVERAMFANKRFAIMSACVSIFLISGRVIGAKCLQANGVALSRLFINTIFSLLFIITIHRTYFKTCKYSCIQKEEAKGIRAYSLQYMITNGLWTMFMLNDVLLLGLFKVDSAIIADYKVAYVLPGCLSLISTAIGTFVSPYFVKNENNNNWIKIYFKKTMVASVALVGLAAAFLFIFAPILIKTIYSEAYLNIVPLMRLLCVSSFINAGVRYTTANILAAMGQVRFNLVVSLIGVILQVILDIIIIPHLSSIGTAIINLIVYFLMAIAVNSVFIAKYRISH